MVQVEECFDIAELPGNPLAEIRGRGRGVNSGYPNTATSG